MIIGFSPCPADYWVLGGGAQLPLCIAASVGKRGGGLEKAGLGNGNGDCV